MCKIFIRLLKNSFSFTCVICLADTNKHVWFLNACISLYKEIIQLHYCSLGMFGMELSVLQKLMTIDMFYEKRKTDKKLLS